ncbi:MAG: hypothetical protein M0006_04240 [Magnetospirillum sp.]|nr:hypothetical protein [Magnetospirillum sp.]
MITVYYKSSKAQWKYELEESEHEEIIKNLMEGKPDISEMFEESLDILQEVSALDDADMDEDEQIDQTIAVAFLWQYFNHLAPEDERILGDIAILEDEDGTGVTVLPAESVVED